MGGKKHAQLRVQRHTGKKVGQFPTVGGERHDILKSIFNKDSGSETSIIGIEPYQGLDFMWMRTSYWYWNVEQLTEEKTETVYNFYFILLNCYLMSVILCLNCYLIYGHGGISHSTRLELKESVLTYSITELFLTAFNKAQLLLVWGRKNWEWKVQSYPFSYSCSIFTLRLSILISSHSFNHSR